MGVSYMKGEEMKKTKYLNSIIVGVFLVFIVCLLWSNLHWQKKAEKNRYMLEEQVWAERQLIKHINTDEKTKYINTTSFYYKVMGWYGHKPQDKKGMSRWTKVLLCQKQYEYEKLIGLPKNTFNPVGLMESNFDQNCSGGLDEGGYLQCHRQAVGQAYIFWHEMPPYLQKEFKFYYKSKKDLYDPFNCLKIAACRMWGLKRIYNGDMMWIISTYHWGLTRMLPLYRSPNIPKKIWKFYRIERDPKTGVPLWRKTSTRNPLMYYFIWYEIQSAFNSGRKDINVETIDYMKLYMKRSPKEKQNWINSWRYNQQLLCVISEFKEKSIEYEKTYERMNSVALRAKKTYLKYYKDKDWKQSESIFKRLVKGLKKIVKK